MSCNPILSKTLNVILNKIWPFFWGGGGGRLGQCKSFSPPLNNAEAFYSKKAVHDTGGGGGGGGEDTLI